MAKGRHTAARVPRAARRAGQPGFTLIEVLLSIVLIGVGLVAVVGLLMAAGRTERRARCQMYASQAVQDMLGEMDAAEFVDITTDNAAFAPSVIENHLTAMGVPSPQASIGIAPWPESTTEHLKRVTILVEYGDENNAAGIKGSVKYETLIANGLEEMFPAP